MIFRPARPARSTAAFALFLTAAITGCATSDNGGAPGGSGGSQSTAGSGGATGSGGSTTGGGGGTTSNGSGGQSNNDAASVATGGASGNGGASGASDGGSRTDSAGTGGDTGAADGGTGLPPLAPCTAPAVSRLKVWEMQVVGGTMTPPSASPLRLVNGAYEMHVAWVLSDASGYGTANTPLNNQGQYTSGADPAKNAVDLSAAPGVVLEYSLTGPAYLQIRTGTNPHGGDHYRANLTPTGDAFQIVTLKFADFRLNGGPSPPGPDILKDVFSFTFVGAGATTLTLRQVQMAGFTPPCN
ncbi:MAG TPA: hypothetical protein VGL59_22995 [Polyangia bacterium]|jgi:hypothetical protein